MQQPSAADRKRQSPEPHPVDFFQTAFGDANAGQLGNGLNRFQKRVLYGGLDQTALEFIEERSSGQSQRLVEGKNAWSAGPGVAHTDEFHGSKDGGQGSVAQTAVRVNRRAVGLYQLQGRPDISVAAMLQMGLEEQALDLAAFDLLLGFDLVERSWRALAEDSADSSSENQQMPVSIGIGRGNKLQSPCAWR